MQLGRRRFLHLLAQASALVIGAGATCWRRRAGAVGSASLALRAVESTDAAALQAIMASSVADADAFFGKCGEWSLAWAQDLVARCPDTVVLSAGTTPIAFLEIPPIRAALPPLPVDATDAQRAQHALRTRNRTTFRVTAAGVRDDLLAGDEALRVFRTVLAQGFARARALGYETVEAVAPWAQHPRMARQWTDYPGLELVEPPSISETDGKSQPGERHRSGTHQHVCMVGHQAPGIESRTAGADHMRQPISERGAIAPVAADAPPLDAAYHDVVNRTGGNRDADREACRTPDRRRPSSDVVDRLGDVGSELAELGASRPTRNLRPDSAYVPIAPPPDTKTHAKPVSDWSRAALSPLGRRSTPGVRARRLQVFR